MKTSVNLAGKGAASLAGTDALDLYLKKMRWNSANDDGPGRCAGNIDPGEEKAHVRIYCGGESNGVGGGLFDFDSPEPIPISGSGCRAEETTRREAQAGRHRKQWRRVG